MNKRLLALLGGFFLLSLVVAYLVPDTAHAWPLLDFYANFASTVVPMIRRIEALSVRLHMAPSYYFSLMWVALSGYMCGCCGFRTICSCLRKRPKPSGFS